jgi:hypothetical protein
MRLQTFYWLMAMAYVASTRLSGFLAAETAIELGFCLDGPCSEEVFRYGAASYPETGVDSEEGRWQEGREAMGPQ